MDHVRYLPPPSPDCPIFEGDSEWHPFVDGAGYLSELSAVLRAARPGDTVSIAGFQFDPTVDLDGRSPGEDGHDPLGPRLATLAARGVDVRLLLATRVIASSVPGAVLGGFRDTALHAADLRELRVDGRTPLAERVLLDHSGTLLGSNHQKFVVTHVGGELRAYVGGVDLVADRWDETPHDRLRLDGEPWGWHDAVVRLRGPAASHVWDVFGSRWREAATLPRRWFVGRGARSLRPLHSEQLVRPPGPAPAAPPPAAPATAVRVSRSMSGVRIDSFVPSRRVWRSNAPRHGIQEIFTSLTTAIDAARHYVYLEDQYLEESIGGDPAFELYPSLRAAAARGVKVVLVGSGTRDPEDTGIHIGPINRNLNPTLRRRLVGALSPQHHRNLAVCRVENTTVHAKLLLVDDVFASIGSANMFSRSMVGTDCELAASVATATGLVRDLRTEVWADHLRAPLTDGLRARLADPARALGIWRAEWAPGTDWRRPDRTNGFLPGAAVLSLVGP